MINSSTILPFYYGKLMKSSWPYGSLVLCKLYPLNNQVAICIHHLISWIVWQEYNRLQLHKYSHMVHKYANGLLWLSDDCIMALKDINSFHPEARWQPPWGWCVYQHFWKNNAIFYTQFLLNIIMHWPFGTRGIDVFRLAVLLSICPSVCPSVCLTDWLIDQLTITQMMDQPTDLMFVCPSVCLPILRSFLAFSCEEMGRITCKLVC